MVDSIYEQSLENKDKPASFYAISRSSKTRTAALELSKFRMPVYGDDHGDVYPNSPEPRSLSRSSSWRTTARSCGRASRRNSKT